MIYLLVMKIRTCSQQITVYWWVVVAASKCKIRNSLWLCSRKWGRQLDLIIKKCQNRENFQVYKQTSWTDKCNEDNEGGKV